MKKNNNINTLEFDLNVLFELIWKGKWKIIITIVISLISVLGYSSIKLKNFTALTKIKPATVSEINKYYYYNNLVENSRIDYTRDLDKDFDSLYTDGTYTDGTTDYFNDYKLSKKINKFFIVDSDSLFNLYIMILEEKFVFEEAIRKFNLLDASQYSDEKSYNEAIIKIAASIEILKISKDDVYPTIKFEHDNYDDIEKWKNILTYVDDLTNKFAKQKLQKDFENAAIATNQAKKYLIEVLKQRKDYQLEDLSFKIENLKTDYDYETKKKLSFLKEQSEIAKKLGIAKNTIEVQTFGNENGMLTSVNNADSPFYLRGYEAIDKQIELINLRTDKTFFIDGLFELEQNLRSIKQNKIVERIQDDKSVERIKLSYKSTPLDVENQFYAASANVFATSYSYYNEKIIIAISIILGLVIGIFYVVISNSFQSNRVLNKK